MSELKRQCLIRELQEQGFYLSRDGQVLEQCSLEQLETEISNKRRTGILRI